MQVDLLMRNDGAATYYTPAFRSAMESFMTIFRTATSTQTVTVLPGDAARYDYDFYGLLTYLKVPLNFHFTILRVNKFNDPRDYRSTILSFLMPDQSEITRIMQTMNSTSVSST